jgi:hypothetical protein
VRFRLRGDFLSQKRKPHCGAPPTSTPLEVRMYRKELHEKIDALPYADARPELDFTTVTEPTSINAQPSDSDDEPLGASFGLGASTYTERDFSK